MTNEQTYVETPRTKAAVLPWIAHTQSAFFPYDVVPAAKMGELERETIALQKQLEDRDNEIQRLKDECSVLKQLLRTAEERVKELQILPILAPSTPPEKKEAGK